MTRMNPIDNKFECGYIVFFGHTGIHTCIHIFHTYIYSTIEIMVIIIINMNGNGFGHNSQLCNNLGK